MPELRQKIICLHSAKPTFSQEIQLRDDCFCVDRATQHCQFDCPPRSHHPLDSLRNAIGSITAPNSVLRKDLKSVRGRDITSLQDLWVEKGWIERIGLRGKTGEFLLKDFQRTIHVLLQEVPIASVEQSAQSSQSALASGDGLREWGYEGNKDQRLRYRVDISELSGQLIAHREKPAQVRRMAPKMSWDR